MRSPSLYPSFLKVVGVTILGDPRFSGSSFSDLQVSPRRGAIVFSEVYMSAVRHATIEDLYHVPENGKAELVNGELVLMPPTGDLPSSASGEIFASLREYARRTGKGRAYPDNAAFLVNLPHRKSFSPDAAFYIGPRTGGKFLQGAPIFAVEVRSENDYGPKAERDLMAKRADYFAAGTLVVWDVDVLRDETIRVYRSSDPAHPTVYAHGEIAEADPALPGWTMPVDEVFA
jgi:Uma2 family endonuclease